MNSDIDLYDKSADQYEALQEKRPDYTSARKAFLDFASSYLETRKGPITIADFCCGMGNNTRLIADHFNVEKATLIDINEQFLQMAQKEGIRSSVTVPIVSDVLKVSLKPEHDIVISMFAYHHVPDADKAKFIEIAKGALRKGGVILLGEIYSPDKRTTLAYYERLLDSIAPQQRTPELETFLRQTANSDQFEYKVSQKFAHDQLNATGFTIIDHVKVWPTDRSFNDDVGTFVEVWQLK